MRGITNLLADKTSIINNNSVKRPREQYITLMPVDSGDVACWWFLCNSFLLKTIYSYKTTPGCIQSNMNWPVVYIMYSTYNLYFRYLWNAHHILDPLPVLVFKETVIRLARFRDFSVISEGNVKNV